MSDHDCDSNGLPALVIDETGDEPITDIYPACSKCGKPQVVSERSVQNDEPARLR